MDDGADQKKGLNRNGTFVMRLKLFLFSTVSPSVNGIFLVAVMFCIVLTLTSCKEADSSEMSASFFKETSYEATLSIDLEKQFPVNPYLLGSNVQWVDRGDGVLTSGTLNLSKAMVNSAKALGISVLRYPGGSLSDLYHWKDGLGTFGQRGKNNRFHGQGHDKVLFGTKEFLALCKTLGAEPMITVNVITGTPADAAAWVKKTNIARFSDESGLLPKVKFWEIGNEPYLVDDNQRDLSIKPNVFAQRASQFIHAMKSIDPSIKVGIPLRSDKLAGVPATPLPGYNKVVLQGVREPFDFVSVHSAYYPFIYDHIPSNQDIYLAAMAATQVVRKNFNQTNQELKKYLNNSDIPIALTEYNAMFTLGRGETAGYIASFTGALYVADLLLMMATQENLLMANYWSLFGNWYFGAIAQDGTTRPTYHILEGFKRIWKGVRVESNLTTPKFSSPTVGFLPAQTGIPAVSAIATLDQGHLSLMLVNKFPNSVVDLRLNITGQPKMSSVAIERLVASDLFAFDSLKATTSWQHADPVEFRDPLRLQLPPSSISIVEIH